MYELEIKPYISGPDIDGNKSFTFDGNVKIYFECVNETNKIVLHSKGLNIISKKLTEKDSNKVIRIIEQTIDTETDFLTFTNTGLSKNTQYVLDIDFGGRILDELYGFYRSSYFNKAQNKTN